MAEWVTATVDRLGHLGIALLMLLENVFPPIPSELIMPLAGFVAARGELTLIGVALAGTLGALAGALGWYWLGRRLGAERVRRWAERHGRWLTLAPEDIDRACAWSSRHGGKAVFLGRLVPGMRTLISLPAGVAGMPLMPFLAWSAAGTALWSLALTLAGYALQANYHRVGDLLGPIATIVTAVLVSIYLYRVATFRRRNAH